MFQIELKNMKDESGLSQHELADKLGVSKSTIAMWESGRRKPDFYKLILIADFFNTSIDKLIFGEDKPTLQSESQIIFTNLTPNNQRQVLGYMQGLLYSQTSNEKKHP